MAKARLAPAEAPYSEQVAETLERLMPPGVPPLVLFTTLARSERAFQWFMAAGLLDRGPLALREREIMIDRTCARCGSEYEWGVHATLFAEKAGFSKAQLAATVTGRADDAVWTAREQLILELADELHDGAAISDALWAGLQAEFDAAQILELILLAGFYHTVSFLTNGLELPLESYGQPFPR